MKHYISNGNRTEWSPIRSVIIRVITKSTAQRESDLFITSMITDLIIHMKQFLDSDWLRAVQFKCNTSAKHVTPVQITQRNSGL